MLILLIFLNVDFIEFMFIFILCYRVAVVSAYYHAMSSSLLMPARVVGVKRSLTSVCLCVYLSEA